MTSDVTAPAKAVLSAHLAGAPYRSGMSDGLWSLRDLKFPHGLWNIRAPRRPAAPKFYVLRFDLSGYPGAPTAQPWDIKADGPLAPDRWPAGGRLAQVFNPDWRTDALYMPMDRNALEGNTAWPTEYSADLWRPELGIAQYLRAVSDMLSDPQYTGVRGA